MHSTVQMKQLNTVPTLTVLVKLHIPLTPLLSFKIALILRGKEYRSCSAELHLFRTKHYILHLKNYQNQISITVMYDFQLKVHDVEIALCRYCESVLYKGPRFSLCSFQ